MFTSLKVYKISVALLAMMLILLSQSCDNNPVGDTPDPESSTDIALGVERGVLNSSNNQIGRFAIVEFKGCRVLTVHSFDGDPESWKIENTTWKGADSLVCFANLSHNDLAKIKPGMAAEIFDELEFGELGALGVSAPFLMKSVVRQSDFATLKQGRLELILTPMVGYVGFENPADVAIDRLAMANMAHSAQVSMNAVLGRSTIQSNEPKGKEFGFYLYPTKDFTITITQGQTVLTNKIEALNANGSISIAIEGAKPPIDPPTEPDTEYVLRLNDQDMNITNGQTLNLPSMAGALCAILSSDLDLKLQKSESWVRVDVSSSAKSRSLTASHNNRLRFRASFVHRVFEQQLASKKYIFDGFFTPNASRSADFQIVDRATQAVLASFIAKQVGEANIQIDVDDISSSVGALVDGKLEINQIGGPVQFVVQSTSRNIEIDRPQQFVVVSESVLEISSSEFKHTLIYKIEPSTNTQVANLKLTVTDPAFNKSANIQIIQAPLVMTDDRRALMDIYAKLGGEKWTNGAAKSWLSGYPLDQWEGVTTNSQGLVTSLVIKANSNVAGAFPVEVTNLTALESLVVGANQMAGSIPNQIKNLKALKTFKTVGNQMGGDLPRELGELAQLSDLHICGQYHTGKIWKEIQNIPAYKDQVGFEEKVRRQRVSGAESEVILPVENVDIPDNKLRGATLSKVAQAHTISLPGDVEATSFEYSSSPSGHQLSLVYRTSDLMPDNKTMLQATLPANTTEAAITYNIKIAGRNRTTGALANYTYIIEQTAQRITRKDGDVRVFLDGNRANDRSCGLVFMGDGFILEDLQPGGDYDKYADNVLSYIFSKEPFATYKDFFKIYVVYVESPQRGIGGKLGTWYDSNGFPSLDIKIVKDYAAKAPSLYIFARLVAMNIEDWGLTTGLMTNAMNALFQVKNEATALHEYAHTFGLGDEYNYGGYPGVKPNLAIVPNLDSTGDVTKVKWKHFIGLPGYEDVGAYEGGAYRPTGVWRPEKESIMKNYFRDFNHFNAPSREALVKKILYYSEEKYNFENFLLLDKPTKQPK